MGDTRGLVSCSASPSAVCVWVVGELLWFTSLPPGLPCQSQDCLLPAAHTVGSPPSPACTPGPCPAGTTPLSSGPAPCPPPLGMASLSVCPGVASCRLALGSAPCLPPGGCVSVHTCVHSYPGGQPCPPEASCTPSSAPISFPVGSDAVAPSVEKMNTLIGSSVFDKHCSIFTVRQEVVVLLELHRL